MKRVLLQPAFVLHRRAYRETSFLVDLFTPEYGRLTVIAKGIRKPRLPTQGLLQPFLPLIVSWSGKGELMVLTHVESKGEYKPLQGDCLFAGFYLNELLMHLLEKWDAHPGLYHRYVETLQVFQAGALKEPTLRSFEKFLLEELGYGLLPKTSISLQNTFLPDKYYRFVPEQGFVLSANEPVPNESVENVFSGKSLLAIGQENWESAESLRDAKRLMRFILNPLLGSRPLYSRKLFIQPEEER